MKIKYKNKISLKHLKQAAYKQSSAMSEVHKGEARKHQKNYDGSQRQFSITEKDISGSARMHRITSRAEHWNFGHQYMLHTFLAGNFQGQLILERHHLSPVK